MALSAASLVVSNRVLEYLSAQRRSHFAPARPPGNSGRLGARCRRESSTNCVELAGQRVTLRMDGTQMTVISHDSGLL